MKNIIVKALIVTAPFWYAIIMDLNGNFRTLTPPVATEQRCEANADALARLTNGLVARDPAGNPICIDSNKARNY